FYLCSYADLCDLYSVPTRRTSDLVAEYLRYAVDNREEVAALAERQAREAAEAAAAGGQAVGGTYAAQEMAEELPETAQTPADPADRKSTRLNSSHVSISYAVFCLQ